MKTACPVRKLAGEKEFCKHEITRRRPGKAGKGPLPKLPGRVLYRAAADRRNTPRATIRESSRHSYRAGSVHPGLPPALALAMCPVPVPVLCRFPDRCLVCPGRRLLYAHRPQTPGMGRLPRPSRTHSRRRPLCQRQNPAGTSQCPHVFRTAASAERQRHCRPGRFLLLGAHSGG